MNAAISPKPRRLWLYLPFALLLLVALSWSAVWFYGRYRINLEIDNFFARQGSLGRIWSCPERSIAGFPFRIEGRCANPTYRQELAPGDVLNGALKGLTIVATTAGAFTLGHVISEFDSPLVVQRAGVVETNATWKTARSSVRGGINRLEQASLEVQGLAVTLGLAEGVSFQWKAEALSLHLRESADPVAVGAFDLAVRLQNAAIPELDNLLQSRDPITLELDARILKLASIDRRDWRVTLEAWRGNGGSVLVEQLKLSKGAPRLEAKGELSLDAQRRLQGQLATNFVNAGQILQQFGIGGTGNLGGLIGGLLGGQRQADQQRERSLRLPLVFEDGRIAVGPFKIPKVQLRPLY